MDVFALYSKFVFYGLIASFLIGLYNLYQLEKNERKSFFSFHCYTLSRTAWLVIFPIVVINYGLLCVLTLSNIEKNIN